MVTANSFLRDFPKLSCQYADRALLPLGETNVRMKKAMAPAVTERMNAAMKYQRNRTESPKAQKKVTFANKRRKYALLSDHWTWSARSMTTAQTYAATTLRSNPA